jgi:glycine hydroxymethyltransferase
VGSILLVCTGNICRSPMAEGLMRRGLGRRGVRDVDVRSAGVAAWDEQPPSPEAITAMQERGVDIAAHQSRRLGRSMIDEAELVIAMATDHRHAIVRLAPGAESKTFTLKELAELMPRLDSWSTNGDASARLHTLVVDANDARRDDMDESLDRDVADPLGLGLEAFRATAWELDALTERVMSGLFGAPRPVAGGFVADWDALRATDPEVADAIESEVERERTTLRLIASENYTSPAVLAALASTMNNKYAEGYPGRRYYGGCQFVDVTETLAIERAKELFSADHANVQPHAGAQANLAVYAAFLDPKDTTQKVLGLTLPHGGHLTHGSPVNVSGKWFSFVGYEVERETERIDMDRVRALALEHRPRLILAGFTAYPRVIDFAAFRRIADEVGAIFMVDAAHFIGLVAGGAYPSPVPYADVVTFTTHKTLRGPRGAIILCRAEHAKAIDKGVFPMMQGGPLEHVIAAKAVCLREAMSPAFAEYAHRTVRAARALADGLAAEGLRVVSGGTDSHLALVDVRSTGMTGAEVEVLCQDVGIALNKNAIPFDPLPPSQASGIRVGTPGPATLGMDAAEMAEVARAMGGLLTAPKDEGAKTRAREVVRDLMARFPAYPA